MPSTTSSSVSSDLASSTVITPSLPTFFIASARKRPISASPLAEMVPTWAISSLEVTFLEFFLRSSTTASTARSMPRLRSIGFMPAATALAPSLTMAAASTVAVVVPSPAMSEVFDATSRTIWAPMFSNLSSSSISLATVTPSLVMRGAPNDFSITTFRPFGPSVTFTVLARMSTPRSIFSRASTENLTSLAAMVLLLRYCSRLLITSGGLSGGLATGAGLHQHAHDVVLFHDQILGAVDLDLGARPFAEQHAITHLKVDRNKLAGLVTPAGPDRYDLALLRLLLGGIGNDDASGSLFLGLNALDDYPIVKRTEFHCAPPRLFVEMTESQPSTGGSLRHTEVCGCIMRRRRVRIALQGDCKKM